MTNRLKTDPAEEREADEQIAYLTNLFKELPEEDDPDFDTLSFFEQEFLASTRTHFATWQDLSIKQEEILYDIWKKWHDRK